jgi:type II secretory ATPase GspE/PulE/Tfp pilus assembly ATPase PilB-like protein
MLVLQEFLKHESIIEAVDALIAHGIKIGASDIHLEPLINGLRIRLRLDGMLQESSLVHDVLAQQLVTRIKLLAQLNIAEKRIPQDGKFQINLQQSVIDLRVATFPTVFGEKVVIRILDRFKQTYNLDLLGMSDHLLAQFKMLIHKQGGFLLVTGPTGSGKSTTLYAALSLINTPEKHIITLEDPVEYTIAGITQGQVQQEAGFTFEKGVRALLRQDPDILMIGEIRDQQTACIAIESALTGHLVMSTLHTTDAPSAITRLMDMEIEPYLIRAALTGVLAQRLVRKNCQSCTMAMPVGFDDKETLAKLGITTELESLYVGRGCIDCQGRGYKGRVGLFELLIIDEKIRPYITEKPDISSLRSAAIKNGLEPMIKQAEHILKTGSISLKEVARVFC